MSIGENIKSVRKIKGLTQNELAKEIGISRSYLGDLEKNRRNPSTETIEKLAKKLGVSVLYLIKGIRTLDDDKVLNGPRIFDINEFDEMLDNKTLDKTIQRLNSIEYTHENRDQILLINTFLNLMDSYYTNKDDKVINSTLTSFFDSTNILDSILASYLTVNLDDSSDVEEQRVYIATIAKNYLKEQKNIIENIKEIDSFLWEQKH